MCRPMPSRSDALDFATPSIRRAWSAAWLQLRSCSSYDGLGVMLSGRLPHSPLTRAVVARARPALPQLIRSIRQLDLAPSVSVALQLLGAGPGLTPSWDDLLIGLLCGLRATCRGDLHHNQFSREFGGGILGGSEKTTAVSRAFVLRTINGSGPKWVEDALAAIAAGDSSYARSATARALGVGHTSGTDTMIGAILGAAIWQRGNEPDQVLSALSCDLLSSGELS